MNCSTMHLEYTQYGLLDIIPGLEVYYNPQSISNLLSMSVVTSKYRMTMDSGVEDAIIVHLERNQDIKFTLCGHGLYCFETTLDPWDV